MKWTTDQEKVINIREKNILVSAAAGSGKTAVLVQRILERIMDKDNPINVDQMLIVTFTKAAAAQMREKIQKKLEEAVEENPENTHLVKQLGYLRGAQISTIDGFCNTLVKNYYDTIDLNPDFRIADETELLVIKKDVLESVLEKYYEEENPDFLDAVESICYGHNDDYLEEIILKLYEISTSHVDPEKWLEEMTFSRKIEEGDKLEDLFWCKEMINSVHLVAREAIKACNRGINICNGVGGPTPYIENFEDDIKIYSKLLDLKEYLEMKNHLANLKFSRLKTIKKDNEKYDRDVVVSMSSLRNEWKKELDKLVKKYFTLYMDELITNINLTIPILRVLASITLDFSKAYYQEKLKKSMFDFSDIAHFALDILTYERNQDKPTPIAINLGNFYEEIFIDEYQDSNDVQEALLKSISAKRGSKPQMFMVGDVKQSIYGFRMAKPDLFIDKYDRFPEEELADSDDIKIDLHMNFRSRKKVLDMCNFIFEKSMKKETGRIEYGEKEKLNLGGDFPVIEDGNDDCEVLIYNHKSEENFEDIAKDEAELRMIALRIMELVGEDGPAIVTDEDEEGNKYLRRAKYSDIVLLFRGVTAWLDTLNSVFMEYNIPIQIEGTSGYFSTVEVMTILNFLRILSNPLQDIPYMSVLRSPIGGFTNNEIARIKIEGKKGFLHEMILNYVDNGDSREVAKKCKVFVEIFNDLRKKSEYMSISKLLQHIYNITGYYDCVLALSDGKRRRRNLDILISKALSMEKSKGCSLYKFIRAMDQMKKYTVDLEQAGSEASSDCVNIMTIHKSKGLEFPIVFVAGMGKRFNEMDVKSKVIIHQKFGLGMDYINHEKRVRIKTITKGILAKMIRQDNVAEELRILYVALTRAKDKLIMCGSFDFDNMIKKNDYLAYEEFEGEIPATKILSLTSYMELVLLSLMKTRAMACALNELHIYSDVMGEMNQICPVKLKVYNEKYLVNENIKENIIEVLTANAIRSLDTDITYNSKVYEILKNQDQYRAYEVENNFKSKVSVSELKKQSMMENEELKNENILTLLTHYEKYLDKQNEASIQQEDNRANAALTGTIYHKVFEVFPFEKGVLYAKNDDMDMINKTLDELEKRYEVLENVRDYVSVKKIKTFFCSKLAARMAAADGVGKLSKEQQFVLGKPAREIYGDVSSNEKVLIQGIIDGYFEEEDGLVLMDYKTDRVSKSNGEHILKERYKKQLERYKEALERLTHKKVKECIIYSVYLEKEIPIVI